MFRIKIFRGLSIRDFHNCVQCHSNNENCDEDVYFNPITREMIALIHLDGITKTGESRKPDKDYSEMNYYSDIDMITVSW